MRDTSGLPGWVLGRMAAEGLPQGEGVRKAYARRAPGAVHARWCSCGRPVYAAVASGLSVLLDPQPLSVEGEGFAILAGRYTCGVAPDRTAIRRRVVDLRLSTADEVVVLVQHECGGPLFPMNDKWQPAAYADVYTEPPF